MPPKKRQKTASGSVVDVTATLEVDPLDQIDSVVGDLLQQLQKPGVNVETLKDGLLTLKGIQNELFADLRETEAAAKERKAILEKKSRQLDGLRYEQSHLETEIETCQNFETNYLHQIVKDEQGASIEEFLGADVMDPANKQKIMYKLNMEINARGSLQRDLQTKQKKLATLQDQVKKKKLFLQNLPNHLASIERASMPLQKTMYNSDSKTQGLRMNGTERRARLDAAQSLSLPLFTLFSSLQQHLDQAVFQDDTQALALAVQGDKQEVLLHVPIAEANHGRPKKVTVHFQYVEASSVITAVVSSGTRVVYHEIVLQGLFPNEATSMEGKVYGWCNYLAGLHHVEKGVTQNSVRAIVRVLWRRFRANSTLKTILASLQRHQVPSLPDEAAVDGTLLDHTCRVGHFVSISGGDDSVSGESFKVVFRKGSEQLIVHVELHKARYPEVPPKWTLNVTEDGKPPLYDERLAALEQKVNVELLAFMKDAPEVAGEWILVHQLHRIMEAFDSW
eukprot:scaffold5296_cov163-Amphora_coffeaeformis.AAC.19